ncbi:hypothetical protein ACKWTF_001201 [Chironomus riparius]
MCSNQDNSWLHGRFITFSELDYGRSSGYNPVLTQTITLIQQFEPSVKDFRPIAIPVTQISDPFGEVSFHSNQINGIISALSLTFPQIQANFPNYTAPRYYFNGNFETP